MNKPISILIADDHPVVRNGLREALGASDNVLIVGEAEDGIQAEAAALELRPDVIIMDIYMPRRSGLESMIAIKERPPGVKVLLLTVSEKDSDLFQATRYGADGYLVKSTGVEELLDAIKKVASGEAVLSSQMTTKLLKGLRDAGSQPNLSGREEEILQLIEQGLTTSEIAERLFLSPNTVSSYVHRLLTKLHLKNRAEAVSYARQRLGSPPV